MTSRRARLLLSFTAIGWMACGAAPQSTTATTTAQASPASGPHGEAAAADVPPETPRSAAESQAASDCDRQCSATTEGCGFWGTPGATRHASAPPFTACAEECCGANRLMLIAPAEVRSSSA